jgi:photosystem II stability/assembly factor-like uncharacterized protein
MKQRLAYSFFLLASLFMLAGTVYSQSGWIRQNPFPPNERLLAVTFTDANTGTAVGFGGGVSGGTGIILRTTNGGTTWTYQSLGTSYILNGVSYIHGLHGVSFINAYTGTVVGESGKIFQTTDGGATWTCDTFFNNLSAVSFTDANTGTAVGVLAMLRTTNGGVTWTSQSSGATYSLRGVFFTDANTGTAVGLFAPILRTTNGGGTWTSDSSWWTHYCLYGVSFTDANTGTIVGPGLISCNNGNCDTLDAVILRTTNGGVTWTSQSSGTRTSLIAVSFTDANTGTAVGGDGTILRTTNGGATWISQSSGTTDLLTGVSFTDANTGTAVGNNGTILRTTTGGVTGVKDNPNLIAQIPNQFALEQNYPNPFNPTTTISYQLPAIATVELKIFDVLGRDVQTLVNERQSAGIHSVIFDARDLSSGVYFYRLQAGNYRASKKLLLLK